MSGGAVRWHGRLLAAPIFVELAYALFLQVCFLTSIVLGGRTRSRLELCPPSRASRRTTRALRHPPPGFDPDRRLVPGTLLMGRLQHPRACVLEPAAVVSAPS